MQKFLAIPLLAMALLSACSHGGHLSNAPSSKPGEETILPLVGTTQVHETTLSNGLKLLVVEDHSSPTLAYMTWFKVGSWNEVPKYTGLAHFFEHLMFRGTKAHGDGELDRILERAGAEGENAFTNRDYTAYTQEMPKDKLELIAELEADRMVNLVVDDNHFKTEREVVKNERRFRKENSPDGTIYEELYSTAFTSHPYHWPVLGYEEDLDRMEAKDAFKFYQDHYSPNHAIVVVVGDVTFDQVKGVVKKFYGALPAKADEPHVVAPEPVQTRPRHKTIPLNIQVDKLQMGFRIPPTADDSMAALDMLQFVLTGGKSARLMRALIDTGVAGSVDAYATDAKDPTLFVLGANLQKGKHAAEAERIILRELARISREGVPAADLERARNQLSFNVLEGLGSNIDKARFLGQAEVINNGFENAMKEFERTKTVTGPEIQEVVRKYFDPKTRTVIVGTPK